jgi:hypothetical protein
MKIRELLDILNSLQPEAEIKIGGWRESNQAVKFIWDSSALEEKHIAFSYDTANKLTLHLDSDV